MSTVNVLDIVDDNTNNDKKIDIDANSLPTIDHNTLDNIGVNNHSTIDNHISSSTSVHGINGNVVGTTDIQTLSGKTLITPNINTNFALVSTNKYTVTPVNPIANRIYSMQDVLLNASFTMTDGIYYNSNINQGIPPSIGYKLKVWRGTSTTTSGVSVFNVTLDGLASPSQAIFSNLSLCSIQAIALNNTTSAISVPLCSIRSITSTQILINVVRGQTTVIGGPSLTFVPNGTIVQIIVVGI